MKLFIITGLVCFTSLVFGFENASAQVGQTQIDNKEFVTSDLPNPRAALLRSIVMPGWGHQYVDSKDWTRGKVHLAADVMLIIGYFGLNARANNLATTLVTQAKAKAGVSLNGRDRDFELAVANYNNLEEYNDFQLRARRWQSILPNTPENQWQWSSNKERLAFQNTRDKIANAENQLPALLTLMVANRIFSGINAFTKARDMRVTPEASFSYVNEFGGTGITANLKVNF